MDGDKAVFVYYCTCYDSLNEYAYADSRCYATFDEARRRADRLTYTADGIDFWATVQSMLLVGVRAMDKY